MRIAVAVCFLMAIEGFGMGVVSGWVLPSRSDRFEMRPQERTQPVLIGDILYFGNLGGDIFAVQRTQGYVLWQTKLTGGIDGALNYGRSKLYVGDQKGNLISLHARDGSEAWRRKISSEWLSPPAISRDRVYVTTSSQEVYALSESEGKELWQYSESGDEKMTVRGTAGPIVFGSDVFVGFSNGYFVALSGKDGRVVWRKRLAVRDRFYDIDMQAHVDERSVIAATFDGRLYSLARTSGDVEWVFPVGSYGGFLVEEERIYVAGLNGFFYALSRERGDVIWKTPFPEGVGGTPVRAGNYLVVTTSSDPVYALDPKDGKIISQFSLGVGSMAGGSGSPDGWFYALSNYGVLHSFELRPESLLFPKDPLTLALSPLGL